MLRLELEQEVRPSVLKNRARSDQHSVLRTLEVELHEREPVLLGSNSHLVERAGHDVHHGPGARPLFEKKRAEASRVALEYNTASQPDEEAPRLNVAVV